MILADRRYSKNDKCDKLPEWIRSQLKDSNKNLQIDVAIAEAKKYFRNMGQLNDKTAFPRELYFTQEDFPL